MHYGIACEGELRGTADISQVVLELVDDNLKRRFIAGLADTIGSMAKSQRRFTDEHQIISFEIKRVHDVKKNNSDMDTYYVTGIPVIYKK